DVRLTLELGDSSRGSVEVERDIMRLAVLGDAVGKGAQPPGLGLGDRPAIVGDDFGGVFRERIDLGLGEVLTREENMLVKRHVRLSLSWPIADAARCGAPPAVFQMATGAAVLPLRQRGAYGRRSPKTQAAPLRSSSRLSRR